MKTIADILRILKPGLVFHCENYALPSISGPRTVIGFHDKGFTYTRPDHPVTMSSKWPKKRLRIIEGNTLTFLTVTGEKRYMFVFPQQEQEEKNTNGNDAKVPTTQRRRNHKIPKANDRKGNTSVSRKVRVPAAVTKS